MGGSKIAVYDICGTVDRQIQTVINHIIMIKIIGADPVTSIAGTDLIFTVFRASAFLTGFLEGVKKLYDTRGVWKKVFPSEHAKYVLRIVKCIIFTLVFIFLAVIDILFYFDFRVVIQREVTCYRRRANSLFTATDNTAAKTIQSR